MPKTYSDYTQRLERLLEACRNLGANLELEPLLQSLIEVATELTRSESSSILVYDKESQVLRFTAAPFYAMEQLKTIGVPIDRSVAGWVFTNAQPMAINQAARDSRIYRVIDRELNQVTRSLLAVPMMFKGETIGVLETINKLGNAAYTEEDVIILETLAAQAAIALQNRRLLEESRSSYEKMVELDRMKSDFIAITSHELRTPLGVILGHASLLQDTVSDETKREVDLIVRSAMQLREFIEEFINIDRFESGITRLRRGSVAILPLIQGLIEDFKETAKEKGISLSVDIPRKNLVVEGDSEKIAIALRELLKNALSFTNPNGQVRIKVEQVPGYVKFSITDNGIGIPQDEQQKIFRRFYQVEKHLTRRHGGMGLGLSIAKDMIEMHGGKIWVESVEMRGSRFTFILPQNAAQVDAASKVFSS